MSHFDPADMDRATRERWNSRQTTVTTLDRCGACDTLQRDVEERKNAFPFFRMTSCKSCFDRARIDAEEQKQESFGHWGIF